MLDNMFSIKDASKMLDCTTQNIYRQKEQLISTGLMEQDQDGSYYLNEKGINYLREKRIKSMKENNQDFKTVGNQDLSSNQNSMFIGNNTDLIDLLKQQISDLKEEKAYWKKEYERKDQELSKANEHLQEMNTTVFQRLLATEEQNRQQEETSKGFFGWLKGNSRH